MNETRHRFLRAIAGELGAENIVEVHVFESIRHGGRETGVAVVAAVKRDESGIRIPGLGEGGESGIPNGGTRTPEVHGDAVQFPNPEHRTPNPAEHVQSPNPEPRTPNPDDDVQSPNPEPRTPNPDAITVLRATYSLTLKGPDRGNWELDIVAEADAPLATVDDVVRGVHRRAGEAVEPERLSGDAFRAIVLEEPWSANAL